MFSLWGLSFHVNRLHCGEALLSTSLTLKAPFKHATDIIPLHYFILFFFRKKSCLTFRVNQVDDSYELSNLFFFLGEKSGLTLHVNLLLTVHKKSEPWFSLKNRMSSVSNVRDAFKALITFGVYIWSKPSTAPFKVIPRTKKINRTI